MGEQETRQSRSIRPGVLLTLVCAALVAFGLWLMHIPLNPHVFAFWIELTFVVAVAVICYSVIADELHDMDPGDTAILLFLGGSYNGNEKPVGKYLVVGTLAVAFALATVSGPLFASNSYSSRMAVEQSTFDEWSDDLLIEGISLMDTDSATMVGNRELGSLQDVVSQFDDARYYQVIIDGTPQKVAPLQYVGFFSWLHNRETGAPGYVLVDPIKQDADYHRLESIEGTGDGMRFVPSACFGENLERHLWMQFPTKALGTPHFELDDEGHPFYVTQSFGFASFMGARYVEGVVVTDPTTGESDYYEVDDVPDWLDVVYDGDLLDEMYDDYGAYSGGFWNSVFAQIGCTRTGGDYGYVMIGDEQWIYTGVTSMGNDSSNVGFLLASEKTGDAYFLPMASADEASAMSSAEGKVQQYGYIASFPSLVSIDGQPTYVMVLKDAGGLIRLYAMVNAESYNVVACESDLVSCKASYEQAMRAAGISFSDDKQEMPEVDATGAAVAIPTEGTDAGDTSGSDVATPAEAAEAEEFSVTVATTQLADDGGDTYLYVLGDDGEVYRIRFSEHPRECMALTEGDTLAGEATDEGEFMDVVSIEE